MNEQEIEIHIEIPVPENGGITIIESDDAVEIFLWLEVSQDRSEDVQRPE